MTREELEQYTLDRMVDETEEVMDNVPLKFDHAKVPMELLPFDAVEKVAEVLGHGRDKYGADNWRTGSGFIWSRLIGASIRHLSAFIRREDMDPETGLPHLAHLACNILFLLEYQLHRFGTDDRFTYDKASDSTYNKDNRP